MSAPIHPEETARLACLRSLNVVGTCPEERFDELVHLALELTGCPSGFVSFIDDCRLWFKAKVGIEDLEMPKDQTFCAYAIASGEPLIVPNAAKDPRFRDHPFVTGSFGLRFYASMPIFVAGLPIGTICVFDRRPRRLGPKKIVALQALARQIETLLEAKKAEERSRNAERRFAAFMEKLPSMAFLKDTEGRTRYVNDRFERLFRLEPGEILGRTDDEWLPPAVAETTTRHDRWVMDEGGVLDVVERIPMPDGVTREWSVQKFPVTLENETWVGGIAVDVTELSDARRSAQIERDFSEAVIETGGALVIVLDRRGHFVRFNTACERLTGWSAEDVLGLPVWDTMHAQEEREAVRLSFSSLHPSVYPVDHVTRWVTRGGETRLIEWRSTAILDEAGEVDFEVATGVDITVRREQEAVIRQSALELERQKRELEEANVRLQELATTDELTRIANHREFRSRLAVEVGRAERTGEPLSLALVDVDWFKRFNDDFGHQAGDEALRRVARTLSEASRALDLVARYGGEEFVVLMPGSGVNEALAITERLRAAIENADWPLRPVTASFGVGTLQVGETGDSLLGAADRALYASKAAGRNRVSHTVHISEAKAA